MTTEGPPVPTGPGASYTYRGRLIPHYETFCFFAIYIYISPPLASVFLHLAKGTCKGHPFRIGLKFQGSQSATPAPMVAPHWFCKGISLVYVLNVSRKS